MGFTEASYFMQSAHYLSFPDSNGYLAGCAPSVFRVTCASACSEGDMRRAEVVH